MSLTATTQDVDIVFSLSFPRVCRPALLLLSSPKERPALLLLSSPKVSVGDPLLLKKEKNRFSNAPRQQALENDGTLIPVRTANISCTTVAGFTLIELLVVVLIIGILSAVALPQYTKAVEKSRVTELIQQISTYKKAAEVYYLANGTYSKDPEALDISFPNCVPSSSGSGTAWRCPNWNLDGNNNLEGRLLVLYCPSKNSTQTSCEPTNSKMIFWAPLPHAANQNFQCVGAAYLCDYVKNSLFE